MKIRYGTMLLAVFGLAACGGHSPVEKVEPTPLTDFSHERQIKVLWSKDAGSGSKSYLRLVPALDGNSIYVGDSKGRVTAINLEDGRERWSVDTDLTTTGGTAAADGIVVIADRLGQVVALERRSLKN